jgi:hypothetical protein
MEHMKIKYYITVCVGILLFLPLNIFAKGAKGENNSGQRKLAKTSAGQIATAAMDINNLNALQENNGFSDFNPNSNLEGTVFPIGTGKNAVFQGGFLWGGYVPGDAQVRVGGSAYRTGLEPGPINSDGQPADPTNAAYSIYRVRPDVYPGGPSVDLTSDAAAESYWNPGSPLTTDQLRAQYESDWTNWPAKGNPNAPDLGAPFYDGNGNGKYDPDPSSGDIPGVPGASQTIYYVANDENPNLTTNLYGTQPLGLEVHVTMWAYALQGALGNMYFKKWDLINKGYQHNTIDSMFVSYWTDVDLGTATDDLVGCDTTLSLQYCYNGEPTDATYAPLPPPATGFDFFQGPIVQGSASDSAIFEGKIVHGMRNLPMTAAYFFVNGDANFGDPPQGEPDGSTQFYHFFNGEYGLSGLPFTDPNGKTTKFAFSGDPVAGTGWLDGVTLPPGDRRQGMASGPFNMAPGDTQEVVVAEMFAGAVPSVNYLQAVSLLKVYDQTAQNAYDHFFNLPSAPPAPHVQTLAGNNKVTLDWGENQTYVSATENSNIKDEVDSVNASGGGSYKFEGYNVYQLPYFGASQSEGKIVATYDVVDGVSTIPYTDPVTRTVEPSIAIQSGSDSGIKRYFVDSTDAFNGNKPLNNGTPYYFAVTAYSYNPKGVPQSLENPLSIITVTPQSANPGYTIPSQGTLSSNVQHTGTANASVNVQVVNPSALTGDQYKITLHNEMYSLGASGQWTDITAASKKLAKAKDLTGSSISATAGYTETKGIVALHYLVDVESSNYDYCDGVKLQLPAGVVVDSLYEPVSNNDGSSIPYKYDKTTNTIFYGILSEDTLMSSDTLYRSGDGIFAGGEDIVVKVQSPSLPMVTNYTMFDDNFGATYQDSADGFPFGKLVDVSSSDTVTTVAKQVITQHQWNVTDVTTGNVVLKNQTIYSGVDIYAPSIYYAANGINGPGGSSGSISGKVGANANQTFDGLTAAITGSFNAPTTIANSDQATVSENGTNLTLSGGEWSNSNFIFTDFTLFGYPDGTALTSLQLYNGGVPVGVPLSDVTDLQQDYELRWTGVLGDTTINGQTLQITKSGGQMVTIIGASGYSLANHPLNPSPGTSAPFLVRVPFEIWNVTKNEQVNVVFWDRSGDPTKSYSAANDVGQVWNTNNRVYCWIVNTKYTPTTVLSPTSQTVADSATWNLVVYQSTFTLGDVVKITYANPLQVGGDSFTFTAPKSSYSADQAKVDINKINVFPNPYYGVNYLETTKYSKFVQFSHLPQNAIIRIFNLGGTLVKTITHNDANSQFEKWDLTNESGLPVGSGLYIAYIDMPNLGATKILKFAIIQEQQIPDHF